MNEIDFNAKTSVTCYHLKLSKPTREGGRVSTFIFIQLSNSSQKI